MTREAMRVARAALALGALLLGGTLPAGAQVPEGVHKGPDGAPSQLTLFCSIESEACARVVVLLGRLLDERPQAVAVSFRHAAPQEHRASATAYRTALAAARQGKGWEVLDTLLANRATLQEMSLAGLVGVFSLDGAKLAADLADAAALDGLLAADAAEAERLGVKSVPALFVNGKRLEEVGTYDALLRAVR